LFFTKKTKKGPQTLRFIASKTQAKIQLWLQKKVFLKIEIAY